MKSKKSLSLLKRRLGKKRIWSSISQQKQISNSRKSTDFFSKISIYSPFLRKKQSIAFMCIQSKSCFTKYTLIHRIHLHKRSPFLGHFHFLNWKSPKKFFHLFFCQNLKPTLNSLRSTLLCPKQDFALFQRRNSWNRSCCIEKPKTLGNLILCFFPFYSSFPVFFFKKCLFCNFYLILTTRENNCIFTRLKHCLLCRIRIRISSFGQSNRLKKCRRNRPFLAKFCSCFRRNPFKQILLQNRSSLFCRIDFCFHFCPFLTFFCQFWRMPEILIENQTISFHFRLKRKRKFFPFGSHVASLKNKESKQIRTAN